MIKSKKLIGSFLVGSLLLAGCGGSEDISDSKDITKQQKTNSPIHNKKDKEVQQEDTNGSIIGELYLGYFADAKDVVVSSDENYAYVIDTIKGLEVIDISNPKKPTLVDTIETFGGDSIEISSDYSKILVLGGGLRIYDISTPSAPKEIGILRDVSGEKLVLSADNTKAYIAGDGVDIVDISTTNSPSLLSHFNLYRTDTIAVSADNKTAYITDGGGKFVRIDISDPENVKEIGAIEDIGIDEDIVISNDDKYAYGVNFWGGLVAIDLTTMKQIGYSDTTSSLTVILSKDNTTAYVADTHKGVRVFDVTDPSSLKQIGILDTKDYTNNLDLSKDGTKVYVADHQYFTITKMIGE